MSILISHIMAVTEIELGKFEFFLGLLLFFRCSSQTGLHTWETDSTHQKRIIEIDEYKNVMN